MSAVLFIYFLLFSNYILFIETTRINSICDLDVCHCDGHSRVRCHCKHENETITIQANDEAKILITATEIEIRNCARVHFLSDAVINLRELRRINVYDTKELYLNENSLYWRFLPSESEMSVPGLRIGIHNTTLKAIPSHSIKGRIDEIFLNNSIINEIRSFAFSNFIGLQKLEIKDCLVQNIDTHAFKKFNLEIITIEGTEFHTIPSRMFSDLSVRRQFRMKNVTAENVQSGAFLLNDVKNFLIEDSRFNLVEGDAFRATTMGPVVFRNITFGSLSLGAFAGFTLSASPTVYGPMEFVLENITLVSLKTGSLQVDMNSYSLVIKSLKVNQPCECSSNKKELSNFESNLLCVLQRSFKSYSDYQEQYCYNKQLSTAIILLISTAVIVVLAVTVFIIVCILSKKKKGVGWITSKKSPQNATSDKEFPVILPDGRTYKETELHVIVERAQLLTTDL